jgi:hypothetical protein
MTTTTTGVSEIIERVLKPIQQFTRGWMMVTATSQRGTELGLDAGYNQFWIVGRAGVLGECPWEVAASGLAFLSPDIVQRAWNELPAGLTHLDVAHHYATCCTGWGTRELTRLDADRMERLDAYGRRIAEAAPLSLGSLFAGWRALSPPADVGGRVALTTHVLREMRGAAHIAAVTACGISPLDAVLASPAVPPRTGPPWAEHLHWKGPFRDPEEVRAARLDAERMTSAALVPAFGALDADELADFAELVETTRNAIDM